MVRTLKTGRSGSIWRNTSWTGRASDDGSPAERTISVTGALRRLLGRAQVHGREHEGREPRERRHPLTEVDVVGVGVTVGHVEQVAALHDHHELARGRDGQGLQEQRVHEREQAGVDADSQREGEDGDGGEAGSPSQRTEGVVQVAHDLAVRLSRTRTRPSPRSRPDRP